MLTVRKKNLLDLLKRNIRPEEEKIIFTQLPKTLMINSQNFIVSPNELNLWFSIAQHQTIA